MQCAICGIPIEKQTLEISGIKVPALCEKHMKMVNRVLDNQAKYMEEHYENKGARYDLFD